MSGYEKLNSKWIDEHVDYADVRGGTQAFIHVDDLQNLLVPKQDVPVIPKFVAEWISERHEIFDLYPALKRLESNALIWEDLYKWYRKNTHKFVNAYLTGKYEVEEEQKYYAKIKGHDLVNDSEDGYWNVDGKELYIDNIWHDYSGYKTTKLTKDEWANLGINEDNADFVKVEELEE